VYLFFVLHLDEEPLRSAPEHEEIKIAPASLNRLIWERHAGHECFVEAWRRAGKVGMFQAPKEG
jgi:hypothetical protein